MIVSEVFENELLALPRDAVAITAQLYIYTYCTGGLV